MKGTFMTEPVRHKVHSFTPECLTTEEWAAWGPGIIDNVYDVSPETVDQASRTVSLLSRFAADAQRWGWEPPLAEHLTLRSVDRHCSAFTNEGARRTRRSALIAIGRIINPETQWPPVREKMGRSRREPPYDRSELVSLHEGAEHREPRSQRRLFQVGLSLGLAAGLDGRTIHDVTTDQIRRLGPSRVCIDPIGARPVIEVRGLHGKWISYWAANTEPGCPVIGSRSVYNGRLHTLVGDDGTTRMSMARLRTTFIVHLLKQRSLSHNEFLQVAGLNSTSSLDLYREFLPEADLERTGRLFAALPPILEEG